MFPADAASFYSNQYDPQATCEHCGGTAHHEKWCRSCDAVVRYAYAALSEPEKLTLRDRLILHALGVSWESCECEG